MITAKAAREAAREAGDKKFNGKPCIKHPDNTERWVSNHSCTVCLLETNSRYKKKHPEEVRKQRHDWDWKYPEKSLLQKARRRARDGNFPYDLELSDVIIPDFCPVLGIPLFKNKDKSCDNSPSIDKVIPSLGYVKGNVVVVSHLANRIKNNATLEELKKVFEFYDNFSKSRC